MWIDALPGLVATTPASCNRRVALLSVCRDTWYVVVRSRRGGRGRPGRCFPSRISLAMRDASQRCGTARGVVPGDSEGFGVIVAGRDRRRSPDDDRLVRTHHLAPASRIHQSIQRPVYTLDREPCLIGHKQLTRHPPKQYGKLGRKIAPHPVRPSGHAHVCATRYPQLFPSYPSLKESSVSGQGRPVFHKPRRTLSAASVAHWTTWNGSRHSTACGARSVTGV